MTQNPPAPVPEPIGRIPPLKELSGGAYAKGRAVPTDVTVLRRDGRTMRYWSDGSLRREV